MNNKQQTKEDIHFTLIKGLLVHLIFEVQS